MRRIGIDVGGTNTDAVLLDGDKVVFAVKTSDHGGCDHPASSTR